MQVNVIAIYHLDGSSDFSINSEMTTCNIHMCGNDSIRQPIQTAVFRAENYEM